MKNALYLAVAFVIVWLAWRLVTFAIHLILGPIITVGLILLFCFLVLAVYRAMSREKNVL